MIIFFLKYKSLGKYTNYQNKKVIIFFLKYKSLGKYTIYQNKNYLQNFQYFKAESVTLGKTLIFKLVNVKLRSSLV